MQERFNTMLGFAQRAGKIASGESAAQAILRKKKGRLVIVAKDASDRTRNYYIKYCATERIPCLERGSQIDLGRTIGRSPRSVVVITDEGFAKAILDASREENTCDAE